MWGTNTPLPKIAFHIGVESSNGGTREQNDWDEYKAVTEQ